MAKKKKVMTVSIGIAISPEHSHWMNRAMELGEYASVSHYFRVLIERDHARLISEGKLI